MTGLPLHRRRALSGVSLRVLLAAALAASLVAPAWAEGAPRPAPRSRAAAQPVGITSLEAALARAFATNPDIQAQRGQVRATNETIAQARAAGLPQVSATAYAGVLATRSIMRGPPNTVDSATLGQRGVALTATQTLFDGWRTQNSVVQAQRLTEGQKQQLRAIEQSILLDVATSYVAVLTGHALVEVQRRNVGFLSSTLANARTRLASGVATPTDVSQAEARLSRGQADLSAVEADLQIARDRFARLVGAPAGSQLRPVRPLQALLPQSREAARDVAGTGNPAVLAAMEQVRAADAAVRIAQGQMLPQLAVQGQVSRDYDTATDTRRVDSAQMVGRVTVPLYSGGDRRRRCGRRRSCWGLPACSLIPLACRRARRPSPAIPPISMRRYDPCRHGRVAGGAGQRRGYAEAGGSRRAHPRRTAQRPAGPRDRPRSSHPGPRRPHRRDLHHPRRDRPPRAGAARHRQPRAGGACRGSGPFRLGCPVDAWRDLRSVPAPETQRSR